MDSSTRPSRRQVIAGTGVGLGALAVAGCGGGGSKGGEPTQSESAATVQDGTTLTKLSDLEVGESVRVKADGSQVIVTRSGQDSAVAFDASCTHQGCPVKPQDAELRCPCHQSRFDPETGEVLGGPADAPLTRIEVHVDSGTVVAGKV